MSNFEVGVELGTHKITITDRKGLSISLTHAEANQLSDVLSTLAYHLSGECCSE